MNRKKFLETILVGSVGVALTPISSIPEIKPKKVQITPTPDYINLRAGGVERMRVGSSGYILWPETDKEIKL